MRTATKFYTGIDMYFVQSSIQEALTLTMLPACWRARLPLLLLVLLKMTHVLCRRTLSYGQIHCAHHLNSPPQSLQTHFLHFQPETKYIKNKDDVKCTYFFTPGKICKQPAISLNKTTFSNGKVTRSNKEDSRKVNSPKNQYNNRKNLISGLHS